MKLETPDIAIDQSTIKRRIVELGIELSSYYSEKNPIIIAVSNGATIFVADLIRELNFPLQLDSIRASSYFGKESQGVVELHTALKLNIKDREVLVVDDILDTGRTMTKIIEFLHSEEVRCVRTCVLLDKPERRVVDIKADYVGFVIPDYFVVGYGLDYNEYYRNLPYVGTLANS